MSSATGGRTAPRIRQSPPVDDVAADEGRPARPAMAGHLFKIRNLAVLTNAHVF
jgi:hypothetical protein